MKVYGHELGKRWFFDVNLELKWLQGHIAEIEKMKADMIRTMVQPRNEIIKSAIANLNHIENNHKMRLNEVQRNLRDVTSAIDSLEDREKQFAILHFMEGKPLEEVADEMYYSFVTVNKIKKDAVSKIIACLEAKKNR